ncbi:hypothetical protein [Weissella confusa]|uniref:hypothetical protein n=1 Tax=Weissella confusa TaxID=1583 RepID=UPI001F5B52F9|nr:hypothetical protein [Weissella confusa]
MNKQNKLDLLTKISVLSVSLMITTGPAISPLLPDISNHYNNIPEAAIESRLAATIHSNQFGYLIKGSVGAMVKFADPGLYLAQVIDQHDKIRNNGWIEAW